MTSFSSFIVHTFPLLFTIRHSSSTFPMTTLLSAGILLAATLVCGTIAFLAYRETRRLPSGRLLPVLLGFGALWYLSMTGQYLFAPLVETLRSRYSVVIPLGFLRPALLLFMAGLAHCYLAEVSPEKRRYFPAWAIYAPTFGVLFALAAFHGLSRPFIPMEGGPAVALGFGVILYDLVVLVVCYLHLTRETGRSALWTALVVLETVLVFLSYNRRGDSPGTAGRYYDLLSLLIPLPLVVWPAYVHARFSFFDVLIKRGLSVLLLAGLFALSSVFGFTLLRVHEFNFPKTVFSGTPADALGVGAFLAFLAMPVGILFLILRPKLDAWAERRLLKRTDYRAEFDRFAPRLQQAGEEDAAIRATLEMLKIVMQAETVEFRLPMTGDAPDFESGDDAVVSLEAPVRGGEQHLGHLRVVGRPDGIRYLSEDTLFLERVAGHLSGALLALRVQRERAEQREHARTLEQLATRARLRALQAQINPHFLFNSLNLLNSLIRVDPERARGVTRQLAAVFRHTLAGTERETVTLGEEVQFIENYLEIAKLRFGKRLSVEIDVPPELASVPVAPMLLQPLVENALVHGIEPKMGEARLRLSARVEGNLTVVEIEDDGVGFDPADLRKAKNGADDEQPGAGIALRNIAERVETLYGSSLDIDGAPGRGTRVRLKITLNDE